MKATLVKRKIEGCLLIFIQIAVSLPWFVEQKYLVVAERRLLRRNELRLLNMEVSIIVFPRIHFILLKKWSRVINFPFFPVFVALNYSCINVDYVEPFVVCRKCRAVAGRSHGDHVIFYNVRRERYLLRGGSTDVNRPTSSVFEVLIVDPTARTSQSDNQGLLQLAPIPARKGSKPVNRDSVNSSATSGGRHRYH